MKIVIDLKLINSKKVTVNVFIFIKLISENRLKDISDYIRLNSDELTFLQKEGFINKILPNNGYSLNSENVTKAKEFLDENDNIEWLKEWRELWPEGIKSGGYYVRSSIKGIQHNMKKFLATHDYPKEVIVKATAKYIDSMRRQGYTGIQLAHNFIEKNNNSTLESYCELFTKTEDHESRISEEGGINV